MILGRRAFFDTLYYKRSPSVLYIVLLRAVSVITIIDIKKCKKDRS